MTIGWIALAVGIVAAVGTLWPVAALVAVAVIAGGIRAGRRGRT